jgi:hypothetical protein
MRARRGECPHVTALPDVFVSRPGKALDYIEVTKPQLGLKQKPRRLAPAGLFVINSTATQRARIASSKSATMLVILIIGFTAGPAVSL